ncbi:phosphatases II [Coniochaeta ligniaria NRRL 30616]|uniref:protein-tyrosine-phosphatase n=1 Tax=Coniochaeta ligniaria NRRL 30616 TaxID=1408157 RepID=A0A1J7JAV8_9PEZI|nr:phosphatases II [Coniochaeta ligniaria NRRL 30616]
MPLLTKDMPSISEIEPGLFIGDFASSSQLSTLTNNNITAIVSLANNESEIWSRPANRELVPEASHMFVCCADSPSQDILARLGDICDFIDKHMQSADSNILVHCTAGRSRSATIVVAYLMRKNHQTLDAVLKHVKDKRRIEPSGNFIDQLHIWEEVGYDIWEDAERTRPKLAYRDFLERQKAKAAYKAKAKHHRDCYFRNLDYASR